MKMMLLVLALVGSSIAAAAQPQDTYLRHALDFQGHANEPYHFNGMMDLLFVFSGHVELCYVPGKEKQASQYLDKVIEGPIAKNAYGDCDSVPDEKGNLNASIGWSYGSSEIEYSISIPPCQTLK